MKKILSLMFLLLTFQNTLYAADRMSFYSIYGNWFLTSINNNSSVTFGQSFNSKRNAELLLNFSHRKIVTIKKSSSKNNKYVFTIKNNKLYISDKKIYLDYAINKNRKYHVDILYFDGWDEDCHILKYSHKGLIGVYNRKGYKLCKE
jgi:hypothetical protein